ITRQISEKGEDIVMSTAMKLREEGKIEGKLEGKTEAAKALLKEGVSIELISKCTGLSEEEIKSIK
ncbi:MAG: transposase, partial [Spirochaetes bacterium]|nr:transposase [Spirochaetota bacterium]MBN2772310.1 transposase [Spirochaetota bacterium]